MDVRSMDEAKKNAMAELLVHMADKIDDGQQQHDGLAIELREMAINVKFNDRVWDGAWHLSDLGCCIKDCIEKIIS